VEKLKLNNTLRTPKIEFNPDNGLFEISGVSLIENTLEFYQPILKWLQLYLEKPNSTTKFIFKLNYSNTSSYQFIYDMLSLINTEHNKKTMLSVDWYYASDDIDMREIGEDYQDSLEVDFKFIEVDVDSL
jgi:hypothetical protein